MYSYGNIQITENELHTFLRQLPKGKYSTFDILEQFRGFRIRNKGISVGSSWNAHFGKILKQCANTNNGLIKEIASKQVLIIDGRQTMSSDWEVN